MRIANIAHKQVADRQCPVQGHGGRGAQGQRVEIDVEDAPKGTNAINLRLV